MKIIESVRWGGIDLKKQTTVILTLIAVPLILASATNAIADGTHGCKIEVVNNYTEWPKVWISIYNGKDLFCAIDHHGYELTEGESVSARAHSQGSARCTLEIITGDKNDIFWICKNIKQGSRCGGGDHTIRVARKGSLVIHEDGTCTKSK